MLYGPDQLQNQFYIQNRFAIKRTSFRTQFFQAQRAKFKKLSHNFLETRSL